MVAPPYPSPATVLIFLSWRSARAAFLRSTPAAYTFSLLSTATYCDRPRIRASPGCTVSTRPAACEGRDRAGGADDSHALVVRVRNNDVAKRIEKYSLRKIKLRAVAAPPSPQVGSCAFVQIRPIPATVEMTPVDAVTLRIFGITSIGDVQIPGCRRLSVRRVARAVPMSPHRRLRWVVLEWRTCPRSRHKSKWSGWSSFCTRFAGFGRKQTHFRSHPPLCRRDLQIPALVAGPLAHPATVANAFPAYVTMRFWSRGARIHHFAHHPVSVIRDEEVSVRVHRYASRQIESCIRRLDRCLPHPCPRKGSSLPATVVIMWVRASTRRIRLLYMSAMKRFPFPSIASPSGYDS